MSPVFLISCVGIYFLILLFISRYTARNAGNFSFFSGNRNSPWYIVAFGMIGTSLSGVTFVSVPGTVEVQGFSYLMVVLGYFLGYLAVAYILLPKYYELRLTSIYDYLQNRFGKIPYKTGALFFIVSRTVGATARLYLVIRVMQFFVLDEMGVPFWLTAVAILLLILAYTFKGGVKTIVWTDTLQTTFMLGGLIATVVFILKEMHWTGAEAWNLMQAHHFTHLISTDILSPGFFLKQLLGGAFIAIAMTGLDQEMMQKNISVKTLKDSQKNILTLSIILIFVNFIFLFLGGLLYLYADQKGVVLKGDDLFPSVALHYLHPMMGIVFIIGLISALFPSADGAITALTASFCLDILGIQRNEKLKEEKRLHIRRIVHLSFAGLFLLCVLIFHWIDNRSVIDLILKLAGYTYGPLLGLFAFGIFTKRQLKGNAVPVVCLIAPVISYFLAENAAILFSGYKFGYELLLVNGIITYLGLHIISKKYNVDITD